MTWDGLAGHALEGFISEEVRQQQQHNVSLVSNVTCLSFIAVFFYHCCLLNIIIILAFLSAQVYPVFFIVNLLT